MCLRWLIGTNQLWVCTQNQFTALIILLTALSGSAAEKEWMLRGASDWHCVSIKVPVLIRPAHLHKKKEKKTHWWKIHVFPPLHYDACKHWDNPLWDSLSRSRFHHFLSRLSSHSICLPVCVCVCVCMCLCVSMHTNFHIAWLSSSDIIGEITCRLWNWFLVRVESFLQKLSNFSFIVTPLNFAWHTNWHTHTHTDTHMYW